MVGRNFRQFAVVLAGIAVNSIREQSQLRTSLRQIIENAPATQRGGNRIFVSDRGFEIGFRLVLSLNLLNESMEALESSDFVFVRQFRAVERGLKHGDGLVIRFQRQ